MWKCPMCEFENDSNLICENCGFDESTNYLNYKTLGHLPEETTEEFMEDLREKDKILLFEGETSLVVKKLKCIACEKVWYVEDGEAENLKACPFCGVAIWEKKKSKPAEKGLYGAIKHAQEEKKQAKEEKRQKLLNSDLTAAYDKKTRTFAVPQGYTHITPAGIMPYRRHMENMVIPESVMFIDLKTIKQCKRLKRIDVAHANQYFFSADGWLYEKKTNERLWP